MNMQVYPTFEDFDPSEPISRVDMLLYEHMHVWLVISDWL